MAISLQTLSVHFDPSPDDPNFEPPADPKQGNYVFHFVIKTDPLNSPYQGISWPTASLTVILPKTQSLDDSLKEARQRVALFADQLAVAARS